MMKTKNSTSSGSRVEKTFVVVVVELNCHLLIQ